MATLHIMQQKQGWVVKQSLDETACVIIAQKTEAIQIARRLADRDPGSNILLHKSGEPPLAIENARRRRRLLMTPRPAR